jgi:hypothetical protein
MAEYTKTATYDASMQDVIRMWNNTTTKKFIEEINTLIVTELDLVDAGVAAYTFTQATWDKAVGKILADLNNETNRKCFKDALDLLAVEWVDIALTGMAYTRNCTEIEVRRCFETVSNSIHKELVHKMMLLVGAELDLIEAAS